jgi:hypothetical protein
MTATKLIDDEGSFTFLKSVNPLSITNLRLSIRRSNTVLYASNTASFRAVESAGLKKGLLKKETVAQVLWNVTHGFLRASRSPQRTCPLQFPPLRCHTQFQTPIFQACSRQFRDSSVHWSTVVRSLVLGAPFVPVLAQDINH